MDVVFSCSHCEQELAADEASNGEQIECPSCHNMIVIPPPDQNRVNELASGAPPPPPPPSQEEEHRHFAVPQRDGPGEHLVKKKVVQVLEVENKEKRLKTKSIKHNQCVEVGHDRFDEVVTNFIHKVGDEFIVSLNMFTYSAVDTHGHMTHDYGVMIVYKG
jgi:DNA-directed RNA polymerase subunit RPC12/RpoP